MRKVLAIMLTLAMVFSLAACGSTSTNTNTNTNTNDTSSDANAIAGIATQGVLRVGMECDYAPFNWTQTSASDTTVAISGGSGYADGYDVQIAKKVADALGLELEIYAIEWDGLIPALTSGTIDCIIAGMSPTAERKMTIDFSEYYWESDMCLVVRKDDAIANAKTLDDLKGFTLCAQADTSHYAVLSQAQDKGATVTPAMESFTTLTTALNAGTIDGYTCETPSAQAAVSANPSLTYLTGLGFEFDVDEVSTSIAVRKDSGLNKLIDEVISQYDKAAREALMAEAVNRQPLSN